MGGDSRKLHWRSALRAVTDGVLRPERPTWLRVAITSLYFGILGPLVGIAVVLVPLSLFLPFAGFVALQVMPQVFFLIYLHCTMPAAITGAYAALVSPTMRPPAWASFYVSTSFVGGGATFVSLIWFGTVTTASDASALLGIAFIGAVSAAICAGLARRWPLGRVEQRA